MALYLIHCRYGLPKIRLHFLQPTISRDVTALKFRRRQRLGAFGGPARVFVCDFFWQKYFTNGQGAFRVNLTPEVRQWHLRCTPKLKVGLHLRYKDQQNRAPRFAFY